MKKLIFSCLALISFLIPSLAQVDHDFNSNDREPIVKATIPIDQIPAAVLKAANAEFDKNNPLTWTRFPFELKEYGWVYDVGTSGPVLNHYKVSMRTKSGNTLEAIYSAEGNLIQTREMSTNVAVPSTIMDAFLKSQYKDWQIVGNKEIISFYRYSDNKASVDQHFRITVEKDKVRKSISFNYLARK